jgi:pimeloyl-ACP methyl ester carboxylesterase
MERFVEPIMIEVAGVHSYVHVNVFEPVKEAARSVLLIHDLAGRSDDFDPLAIELTKLGFRVIAADFPGRGKSAHLPADQYSLRMYMNALHAILQSHALEECWILGQGWGSMIAILLENLIDRPFPNVVLLDLPQSWAFEEDEVAKAWGALCELDMDTKDAFIAAARDVFPLQGQRLDYACELLLERLRVKDGRIVLPVDKHIFHNLEKSAKKRFDIGAAVAKSRARLSIVQSAISDDGFRQTAHFSAADAAPNVGLTLALQCSQLSWTQMPLLLPTVGLFAHLLSEARD